MLIYHYLFYHTKIEDSNQNIVVFYQGNKYDISRYIDFHPGGKRVLQIYNGKDVEEAMKVEKHGENAYKILQKYLA